MQSEYRHCSTRPQTDAALSADEPERRPTAAELVAVRICHDLAGVASAFSNGAEILGDICGTDNGLARSSLDLLKMSAADASARIRLFRRLFGFDPASGCDGSETEDIVRSYLRGFDVDVNAPAHISAGASKALLAFALAAAKALPGKDNTLHVQWDDAGSRFEATAKGRLLLLAPEEREALLSLESVTRASDSKALPHPGYKTLAVWQIAAVAVDAGLPAAARITENSITITFGATAKDRA